MFTIDRIAMASSITTGRRTIASSERIPAFGMLMIGTLATDPYGPGFVIVNVAPWTSSGRNWWARARAARSAIARARPTVFITSASRITGTISPAS